MTGGLAHLYDGDMDDRGFERRRFTRITLDLPTELHQGGASWQVRLIDISLNGLAVTQPDSWDADYSHPFHCIVELPDNKRFEAYAHLVHVEAGTLGFQLEHLGQEQIGPLADLLARKIEGSVLDQELARLQEINN